MGAELANSLPSLLASLLACIALQEPSYAQGIPQFAAQAASRSSYFIDGMGSLYAWGQNGHGQLGNGSTDARTTPKKILLPDGAKAWAVVAAGERHALAVADNQQLFAWGDNSRGQVGLGSTNVHPLTPTLLLPPSGSDGWKLTAAGGAHSLAVANNGILYAWGYNRYGQLGIGSTNDAAAPTAVATKPEITSWISLAAGDLHSLAVAGDGNLYAWGINDFGQLGIGGQTNQTLPVRVSLPPNGRRWQAVSAGLAFSLALDDFGNLYVWGRQGANPTTTPIPVRRPTGVEKWMGMAGGGVHFLALGNDGNIYAGGDNYSGQLGNPHFGTSIGYTCPGIVEAPSQVTGSYLVCAGREHSLGQGNDCTLYSWGANNEGQLGDGTRVDHYDPSPVNGSMEPCSPAATNLPVIGVTVTDPIIPEYAAGMFVISRTGNTTAELDVHFSVAGTASRGIDYEDMTNSMRLPKGAFSSSLQITSLDDILLEGNESVVLTLETPPPNYYQIGTNNPAVMIIADDELPSILPPEIVFVAPPNGSLFSAPANIRIQVHAAHADGEVRYWELYEGSRRLGAETWFCDPLPCSEINSGLDWRNVPPGYYTLTARIAGDFPQYEVGISEPLNILVLGINEFPVVDRTSLRREEGGAFGFSVTGNPNQRVIIQCSPDLLSWVAISTNLFVGPSFEFWDKEAAGKGTRFYRAVPFP